MNRGFSLAALLVVGLLAGGAYGAGKPSSRPGRALAAASQPAVSNGERPTAEQIQAMYEAKEWRRIPGVQADANGFPTGPLPALRWAITDKATPEEQTIYNDLQPRREAAAKMGADRTVRLPKEIAAAKAGKINPKLRAAKVVAKDGTATFKSEEDRAADIDQSEKSLATMRMNSWRAYDPDFIPTGIRAEVLVPVNADTAQRR